MSLLETLIKEFTGEGMDTNHRAIQIFSWGVVVFVAGAIFEHFVGYRFWYP